MKKEVVQVAAVAVGTVVSALATYFLLKKIGSDVVESKPVQWVAERGEEWWDMLLWPINNAKNSIMKLTTGTIIDDFLNPGLTSAQFYLNSKYVTADYRVDPVWRRSMEAANSGIPALFNQLLDDSGRIKTQYRKLINQAVHAGVL